MPDELRPIAATAYRAPFPIVRARSDGLVQWANAAAEPLLRAWRCDVGQQVPVSWAARFALIAASGDPRDADLVVDDAAYALQICPGPQGDHVVVYATPRLREAPPDHARQLGTALLANMSHELRTPLNAIVGYAELLTDELCDRGDHDLLDDLRKITASADGLRQMITDLLEVARIEAGRLPVQLERFDLGDLVDDVALEAASRLEAGGSGLAVELDLADPVVTGDPSKTRRVMMLLVEHIARSLRDGRVILRAHRAEDRVRLEIEAVGGTGLDPDLLGGMPGESPLAGASLGLAIARMLVKQLGGALLAGKGPGGGVVLEVRLPARVRRTS